VLGFHALSVLSIVLWGCARERTTDADAKPTAAVTQKLELPPIHPEADTRIASITPFGNDGTGNNLGVTSATVANLERSLIRFNQAAIETAVGTDALHLARLDLHIRNSSVGWLGAKIDLFPMTWSWPEGTGLAIGGHGPTWVCRDDPNTSFPFGVITKNCLPGDAWGCCRPISPRGDSVRLQPRARRYSPEASRVFRST
jgi:hypothetical protein